MDTPTQLSEFISLESLAETLGVSKPLVARWRHDRQLPAIRLGNRTFFHIPAVAAWLKAREAIIGPDEVDAPEGDEAEG